MRITKFHILIFLFLIGIGASGFYFYKLKQDEIKQQEEKIQRELALQRQKEEEALRKLAEAPVPQPQEPEKKEPTEITYTVQSGETLWSIAKKAEHFGEGHRWYDIWKANEDKIFDFDRIVAGQELILPLDKPKNYSWPKTSDEKREKLLRRNGSPASDTAPTN